MKAGMNFLLNRIDRKSRCIGMIKKSNLFLKALGLCLLLSAVSCSKGRTDRKTVSTDVDQSFLAKEAASIGWEGLSLSPHTPSGNMSGHNPILLSRFPEIFGVSSSKDFVSKAVSFAVDSYVVKSDISAPSDVLWQAVRQK